MSRITLAPNASGTGTLTVAAPNTNTDRTLTLPDATGTVNISGLANEVPAGSAGSPSIYSTGDTNTGVFFPAADTVALTTGGSERMRVDSSGNVGIGTSSPLAKLSAKGNVTSVNLIPDQGAATGYLTTLGLNVSFNGTNWVTVGDGSSSGASAIGTVYGDGALQFYTIPTTASVGQTLTPAQFYATERLRIASAGQIGIGGANYGTSGQVLTSGGSGAAPSWANLSAPTTAQVGAATAALAAGDVGSYAWLTYQTASGAVAVGTTFSGANLRFHGVVVVNADAAGACGVWGGAPSGTWRCMGSNGANGGRFPTNIYLRIS